MSLVESQVFSILEILVQATIQNISTVMEESLLSKFKANDLAASVAFKLTETQAAQDNLKRKWKKVVKRKKALPAGKGGINQIPTALPSHSMTDTHPPTKVPEERISSVSQGWTEEGSMVTQTSGSLASSATAIQQFPKMDTKEERSEQCSGNAGNDPKPKINDEDENICGEKRADVPSKMVWKERKENATLSNKRRSEGRKTRESYWNRKFSCKNCKRTFGKLIHLKAHQALHGAVENPFKCSQYGKRFMKNHRLANDQKFHTGPYICCQCGEAFVHQLLLRSHERLRHRKTRFDCKPCGRRYCQARSLRRRLATSSVEKQHSCDMCGKSFACLSNLSRHQLIHTGEKPFTCLTCGRSFNQLTTLKSHERIHTGERPFICDSCGKGFSQANGLRLHGGWRGGQRGFSCIACGLVVPCADAIRAHHRTHVGDMSVSCRVCGEGVGSLSSLQAHQSRHGDGSDSRTHGCRVCGKSFRSAGSLKIHVRTHTGERPYSCPVCSRKFTQQNSLKSHQLSHTGERPFGCEVCGKAFSSAGNLRRHERVHTGQKPHCCTICQRSFTQLNTLKAHMYVHTGEKQYTCDKCGRSFGYQRNLKSHKCAYNQ